MSIEQAKKVIAEMLQSDGGFRDRVANYILYRGLLSTFDNLKDVSDEVYTQHCNRNVNLNQTDGFCSHLSKQDGQECPFKGALHGYEYWVG